MKKKLIPMLLAAFMLLACLAGCQGGEKTPTQPTQAPQPSVAPATQAPAQTQAPTTAPTEAPTPEPSVSYKTEMVIAYANDLKATSEKGVGDMTLASLAGERLVEYVDGEITPSLAASWTINEADACIDFTLAPNIFFSAGTPVTAEAVKQTYERLLAYENFDWTEMDRVSSVEALDDSHLRINYFPDRFGYICLCGLAEYNCTILAPSSYETPGDPTSPIVSYVGSGPWKVAEYVKNERTVLVPNEYYHGDKPQLEKLTINVISSAESRVMNLQAGDVDAIIDYFHGGSGYTPRTFLSSLQSQGFQIYGEDLPLTQVLGFNYKSGPWSGNATLRKAIACAINTEEIASLYDGWLEAADGYFDDLTPYAAQYGVKSCTFDIERAKELLAQSGEANRELSMIINSSNADEVLIGQLVKDQLSKIGLTVNLEVLDSSEYSTRKKAGEFDLYCYYLGGPVRRTVTRLEGRFVDDSHEYLSYGGSGCLTTPDIIRTVKEATAAFDKAEQATAYQAFYQAMDEGTPCVPMFFDRLYVVASPDVQGLTFFCSEPFFNNVTIPEN